VVAGVDLRLSGRMMFPPASLTSPPSSPQGFPVDFGSLSIDLLIHHESIIADLQNYVNTLSKMILHIQG